MLIIVLKRRGIGECVVIRVVICPRLGGNLSGKVVFSHEVRYTTSFSGFNAAAVKGGHLSLMF